MSGSPEKEEIAVIHNTAAPQPLWSVVKDLQESEFSLRRMLWLRHGCPLSALYGDDGEMQCNACMIDFRREAAFEIERRWAVVHDAEPSQAPSESSR